ncbi:MAG: nucleoside 2-deoxyribosyltransferase [Planctomycetota bacterium]|nr:nucleoside 2-deoxyribosyltransferase [Planctomycetota bacterium]
MKLYLAGPLGFSEAGRHYHDKVLRHNLQALGFELLDPWHTGDEIIKRNSSSKPAGDDIARLNTLNTELARTNVALLKDCDAIVAVLDGPDVDSGTAAEIGYGYSIGKTIYGYRGDLRASGENAATLINLQVAYFITESGGCICTSLDALLSRLKKGAGIG